MRVAVRGWIPVQMAATCFRWCGGLGRARPAQFTDFGGRTHLVASTADEKRRSSCESPAQTNGARIDSLHLVRSEESGQLTLNLTALRPGVSVVRFVDPRAPLTRPNFAWDNADFVIVRILPFDDFSG